MIESLLQLDRDLFFLINNEWSAPILDAVMPLIRTKYFWFPLYLFLILFFIINFRKKSLLILFFIFLMILLSDQISANIIKPLVERLRPCQNESLAEQIRVLIDCGVGYSFTSNHAINHFSIAVFTGLLLKNISKWILFVGLLWATLVVYGQIYVGVHYPLDVIAGGVLGSLIGWFFYFHCRKALERFK